MYSYTYIYIFICAYTQVDTCVHTHICTHAYTYIYVHMHIYVYTFIYIHTATHIQDFWLTGHIQYVLSEVRIYTSTCYLELLISRIGDNGRVATSNWVTVEGVRHGGNPALSLRVHVPNV